MCTNYVRTSLVMLKVGHAQGIPLLRCCAVSACLTCIAVKLANILIPVSHLCTLGNHAMSA